MKITNRSKVAQTFAGVTIEPGETHVTGESELDSLRDEYRALTGKDADGRWKADRVRAEIDKALEA